MKAQHFILKLHFARALFGVWWLPSGTSGKEPTCQWRRRKMRVWSPGQEDLLEDGMANHSSILAWRIPWTEEPGGLQSIQSQSQTLLKQLSTHTHTHAHTHTGEKFKDHFEYKKIRRRTISKLNSVVAFKHQHKLTDMKSCPMEMGDQS